MIDKSIPEAMAYFRSAQMHRDGASILLAQCPEKTFSLLSCECVYLSGYVVECVLKAAIVSNTTKPKRPAVLDRLKYDVKHNLERLRTMLEEVGIVMSNENLKDFWYVRRAWTTDLRYDPRPKSRAEATTVHDAAASIMDWLS